MEFIILILIAVFLYVRGLKACAMLIFFFFLTQGFNLIPEDMTESNFGISKGHDYAILLLGLILFVDVVLLKKRYLKLDTFLKFLLCFFVFLLCSVIYSKFVLHISTKEIIQSTRIYFLWAVYLVFRDMKKEQLKGLMFILFNIVVGLSVLYLFQLVIEENILNKQAVTSTVIGGIRFQRFYNQPDMLYFFTFTALFVNPYKGMIKRTTTIILVSALVLAFHRSLTGFFLFTLGIAYFINLSKGQRWKIATAGAVCLLFIVIFFGSKFAASRTFFDIKIVLTQDVTEVDIDIEDLAKSTFTFRMAHLAERMEFVSESLASKVFGVGLYPEDSKAVGKRFDFKVGLIEELTGKTVQLATGDIVYSLLILYLGYFGTFLFVLLYIVLMISFYKYKNKSKLALASFLFIVFSFGISFFSANLYLPHTFVIALLAYCLVKKEVEEENIQSEKVLN
ncbi:MAG: hypothetical protein LBH12_07015 [Dysgonamonadaceae bacterium]|jgi:uncharacterized protein with PQ loop repeat|nr:hypothetical protein [Dysgonamonadaceae bacterium]